MPQRKTLARTKPVLIAERPDHAFLLNGEKRDLGRWPQMWPTLSNMTVLGHWSNDLPRDRVWTWFSLQLATSEARIAPVSRDHVVPNPRPSEQQHWWCANVEAGKCAKTELQYSNREILRAETVLQWRHVPDYVLSIANDEDGRSRSWQLEPHELSTWDENRSRLRDPEPPQLVGWHRCR